MASSAFDGALWAGARDVHQPAYMTGAGLRLAWHRKTERAQEPDDETSPQFFEIDGIAIVT